MLTSTITHGDYLGDLNIPKKHKLLHMTSMIIKEIIDFKYVKTN